MHSFNSWICGRLKQLFWIASDRIIQASIDGSRQTTHQLDHYTCLSKIMIIEIVCLYTNLHAHHTCMFNSPMHVDGIAVDWISDKLYFHDQCWHHIGVLDLAHNLQKTLANDTNMHYHYHVVHIVVDPTARYIHRRLIYIPMHGQANFLRCKNFVAWSRLEP